MWKYGIGIIIMISIVLIAVSQGAPLQDATNSVIVGSVIVGGSALIMYHGWYKRLPLVIQWLGQLIGMPVKVSWRYRYHDSLQIEPVNNGSIVKLMILDGAYLVISMLMVIIVIIWVLAVILGYLYVTDPNEFSETITEFKIEYQQMK